MNNDQHLSGLVIWFTGIGMALLLGLIVFALLRSGPSHEDILEHQRIVEDQLAYISCLLLIEPADRVPEVVAGCQLESSP